MNWKEKLKLTAGSVVIIGIIGTLAYEILSHPLTPQTPEEQARNDAWDYYEGQSEHD